VYVHTYAVPDECFFLYGLTFLS